MHSVSDTAVIDVPPLAPTPRFLMFHFATQTF